MGPAEGAVEPVERRAHSAKPFDVRLPDLDLAGAGADGALGADQPGHRRVVPRRDVRRSLADDRSAGEVGLQQLGDAADAVVRSLRVGEAEVGGYGRGRPEPELGMHNLEISDRAAIANFIHNQSDFLECCRRVGEPCHNFDNFIR